jgi:hypothetical protein
MSRALFEDFSTRGWAWVFLNSWSIDFGNCLLVNEAFVSYLRIPWWIARFEVPAKEPMNPGMPHLAVDEEGGLHA